MEIQFYDKVENQEKLHGTSVYACGICTDAKNKSVIYHLKPTKVFVESDAATKNKIAEPSRSDHKWYLILRKYTKLGKVSKEMFNHKSRYFYFTTEQECIDKFNELCRIEAKNFKDEMKKSCEEFELKIELISKGFNDGEN